MGRGLLLTALALSLASARPGAEARRQLQDGRTPGTCVYTAAISGSSFEDGQDATSLQVWELLKAPSFVVDGRKVNPLSLFAPAPFCGWRF